MPWTTAKAAAPVLGRALAQGGQSVDTIWFGPDRLASVAELATRHGDRSGQGIHFSADSVCYLWLDRPQLTGWRRAVVS